MQFGIKRLMLGVAAVCSMCSLYVMARNLYYHDRRQVQRALAEIENISIISIDGFHDVTEEIASTSISVNHDPNSVLQISGLQTYRDTGRFYLSRIGKWRFVVFGRRYHGAYKIATGEPVESNYYGGAIELGSSSPYGASIPFQITTLQDLVDHYQEFVELLDSWPRESTPGQVTLSDGSIQYYYVVEDPAVAR